MDCVGQDRDLVAAHVQLLQLGHLDGGVRQLRQLVVGQVHRRPQLVQVLLHSLEGTPGQREG